MWIRLNIAERHPHMDEDHRLSLDVRLGPINGTSPPCGKKSENLSTSFSTGNMHFELNPHIGESIFGHPYLGVSVFADLTILP